MCGSGATFGRWSSGRCSMTLSPSVGRSGSRTRTGSACARADCSSPCAGRAKSRGFERQHCLRSESRLVARVGAGEAQTVAQQWGARTGRAEGRERRRSRRTTARPGQPGGPRAPRRGPFADRQTAARTDRSLDVALVGPARPFGPGRLSRRQDRPRRDAARRRATRGARGNRPRRAVHRPARFGWSLPHGHRISHRAPRRARRAGVCAQSQQTGSRRGFRDPFRVPDGSGQSSPRRARMAGTGATILRHAAQRAIYLGGDRRDPAQPVREAVHLMGRILFEPLALFLSPFAVYALYLLVRARYPLEVEHWTRGRVSIMTLLGLAAAVLGLVAVNAFAPRGRGVYVPAHVENGILVPGRFE